MDDRLLAEGAQVGESPEFRVALGVGVAEASEPAVAGVTGLTGRAVTAVAERREHHMVPDGAVGDGGADLRHHTGGLMAGHQRSRHVVLARDAAQVAAAHAGRHDLHPDLAWPDCGSVLDVLGQADVFFAVPLLDESQHPLAAPVSS